MDGLRPGDLVILGRGPAGLPLILTATPGSSAGDNPETGQFQSGQLGLVLAITRDGGSTLTDEEALIICPTGLGWNTMHNMRKVAT